MNPPQPSDRPPQGHLPPRAGHWQLRTRAIQFGRRPSVMGILNVTPDSFSDGGQFDSIESAVAHARQLIEQGADILDIGGESTRPYASPVAAAEELRRVVPVLERLVEQSDVPLSIDTSKAEVARAALDIGVEIINDVTGLAGDPRMLDTAAEYAAGVCIMHMQGTPQTMQINPSYDDVVAEVGEYLRERQAALQAAGIQLDRICVDPGIGFGKTHQHNLTLLANCWRLHELSAPVLVGHSRKGFLTKVLGDTGGNRANGSLAVALGLASQGVQVVRVHDVAATCQALRMFDACGGLDGQPWEIANDDAPE